MQSKTESTVVHSISLLSLAKIVAVAISVYWLWTLWPLCLLTLIGILMAIALNPVVLRLERFRMKRSIAVGLIAVALLAVIAVILISFVPRLLGQFSSLSENWPNIRADILRRIPETGGLRGAFQQWTEGKAPHNEWLKHFLSVGQMALGGIAEAVIAFALMIYFLLDGARAYHWVTSYFTLPTQKKIDDTTEEMSQIIVAYVGGQFLTSLLAGIFAFLVLSVFKVPGALVLGVTAALFDILPIVGIFLFMIPAVIMALTVSSSSALLIGLIYLGYHQVENYILVPWIYGSRMRLSMVVVLLACLFAGSLGGILATIAILPVVATYPVIERIWFSTYIRPAALREHNKPERKVLHA
jgi:predicted PurR-regulated permease PerM